jgi:hypothetical protein
MGAAVAAILSTGTIDLAAAAVGVAPSTLYRWLRRDEFRAALKRGQREAYEAAIGELQNGARKAVRTLLRNAECDNKAIENDAAKAILDRAAKAMEVLDLAEEVAALNEIVNQINATGKNRRVS